MKLTEHDGRPLSGGLGACCRSARLGLGLPANEVSGRTRRKPRPFLPPELVRLIDALVRAMEREERLLAMYGGNLCVTLWHASSAGCLLDTRFLLAAGADAGAEDGLVLYDTFQSGHLRVTGVLLDAGGSLTQNHRDTCLFVAAMDGRTEFCELLLDRGADIHYRDEDVLSFAALNGHLDTVALLLDRGADAWSERALRCAVSLMFDFRPISSGLAGSCKSARLGLGFPAGEADAPGTPRPYLPPELVRLIDALAGRLERAGRAERLRAMNGGNLHVTLLNAGRASSLLDVRLLLQAAGARAGEVDGFALIFACEHGHLRMAEALLAGGGAPSPLHRNHALCFAAAGGHAACCELLLDRGADVHHEQDQALFCAARHGEEATVALLLGRGADAWSDRALLALLGRGCSVSALLLARRGAGFATH